MNLDRQTFDLLGLSVKDIDGSKIGEVSDYYFDGPTGQVEWLVIGGGMMDKKTLLVPLDGMFREGDDLTTPYTKGHVLEAPTSDAESIDFDTEAALFKHYNVRREVPGRTEDKAPWQQDDSVAKGHRLKSGSASQKAGT